MNTGIAFWKQKGRPASNGGVAQLGEHLPCKQGVKSSNLSISIRNLMIKFRDTYLENCILENTNIFITQKIQDIRDKNQEMFVNANETWTNIHNEILI